MGLINVPKIADYWKTSWESHIPFFGKIMSWNRFQSILSFLHVSHTPLGSTPKKTDKIKMFIDRLLPKFSSQYNPSENISIDETMIGYRGRFGAIQYMPQKPTKWGIKIYSIADSINGYLLNFVVYTGSETNLTTGTYAHLPKTTQLVMNLVSPYLDKGYHLYTDRFYSSVLLAKELENRGTRFTGTLNINRVNLPDAIRSSKKKRFSLPIGGYRAFRDGRSMVSAWRPKKKKYIFMLSTGYTAKFTTITRRGRAPVRKPEVVHAYNQSMNGVDILDQLSVYYCFDRKSVKWWKVFFWCIEVALVNSHIIHKNAFGSTTYLEYWRSIINSFTSVYLQNVPGPSLGRRRLLQVDTPERLDQRKHFLGKRATSDQHECKICSSSHKRKRTVYFCKTCNCHPPLCPVDCFEKYHTHTNI